MKILLTSDWYEPVVNGVVTSVRNLKRELEKRGHEVRVLTLSENRDSRKEGDVYYIHSHSAGLVYPNARVTLPVAHPYVQELMDWKPDIVHSQCEFTTFWFARRIAFRTGAPLIHTYHTIYEDYTHYFSPNKAMGAVAARLLSRKVLDQTDAVIAPTKKVKAILERYMVEPAIFTIPTGIDLAPFADGVREKQLRTPVADEAPVLITVGRLAKEKNIEEILELLADARGQQYRYLLVGDGPYLEVLEAKVQALGLTDRVTLAGMVPPEQVASYYKKGDIFVCASGSETQGLTYIEALASGLPLVCHKDACLEDVLTDGYNGWQYENAQGFFDGLENLWKSGDVYREASAHAAEQAHIFSAAHFAEQVEHVYRLALWSEKEAEQWNGNSCAAI